MGSNILLITQVKGIVQILEQSVHVAHIVYYNWNWEQEFEPLITWEQELEPLITWEQEELEPFITWKQELEPLITWEQELEKLIT